MKPPNGPRAAVIRAAARHMRDTDDHFWLELATWLEASALCLEVSENQTRAHAYRVADAYLANVSGRIR